MAKDIDKKTDDAQEEAVVQESEEKEETLADTVPDDDDFGGEDPFAEREDDESDLRQFTKEEIDEIEKRDGVFFEGRYYYGIGRRKESVAKIQLFTKGNEKQFVINGMDYKEYFNSSRHVREVEQPLVVMKALDKFSVKAQVSGGGHTGQAGAISLGIARALEAFNPDFRKRLRRRGLLTRDSRMVERKKYGKKKARRSPQWSKR